MLLTHSKKLTKNKNSSSKNATKRTNKKNHQKNAVVQTYSHLMLFITIYKKKKQFKLNLGVQMQHCVNACNQTLSVLTTGDAVSTEFTGDGMGGRKEVRMKSQIKS